MPGPASAIDATMDKASRLLVAMRYFECERLCLRAVTMAIRAGDYERLGRICLPLQESRRLIRQQAFDAANGGTRVVLSSPGQFSARSGAGFYLVQPPLIGADARRMRELLWHRQIPCLVLAREPMTQSGRWPLVAVGVRSYRVLVVPPEGVVWTGQGMRRDSAPEEGGVPSVAWFLDASEALGDAMIAGIDASLPAAWRVEDLLASLEAFSDHEKLHQRLAEACQAAAHEPPPTQTRPRVDPMPNSF